MSIMKPPFHTELNLGHRMSQGLVGCWLFNEAPPPLGSAMDLSGNGNHGTLENQTHSVAGRYGPALDFDGVNDAVRLGNPESLHLRENMTVIALVNFDSTSGLQTIAGRGMGGDTPGTEFNWLVSKDAAQRLRWFWELTNGANILTQNDAASGIVVDEWVTLGFVRYNAGTAVKFYINGLQNGSAVTGLSPTAIGDNVGQGVAIGIAGATAIEDLNGKIDHILIYNRALSANEISSLYLDPYQMFKRNL